MGHSAKSARSDHSVPPSSDPTDTPPLPVPGAHARPDGARGNEEEFRRLADDAPALLWVTDSTGSTTFLSRGWYEFTGQTRPTGLGDGWAAVLHPDDREAARAAFQAHSARREPFQLDYRLRRADGEYRWVLDSARPRFGPGGEFLGFVGSVIDIHERKRAREALRQSEEQYRVLAESIPHIVWTARPDGSLDYLNRRGVEYGGSRPGEALGWGWRQWVHPDDLARALELWEEALRTGATRDAEYRLRRADGAYRWHVGRGVALRDRDGAIVRWFGTCTDIHDQKLAEEAVRRKEDRFRSLVLAGAQVVWTADAAGQARHDSPSWRAFTGQSPEEQKGAGWLDALHPDDRERVAEAWARAVAGRTAYGIEYRLRRADGAYRVTAVRAVPVLEPDGSVREWVGSNTDVTELRAAEAELRLRDRAMQAVSQGILITDPGQPDNPIIYASRGFERLTGYAADEVVGRNCRFLQGPETDPAVVDELRAAIRAGRECSAELLNYRKDGTPFWNALFITPVRHEGRVTHFVGVQADVTVRRHLERQLQQALKMEAVGQLAGGVAHDFNNLLTVINGHSELLLARLTAGDRARPALAAILDAGQRAAALTGQLLAFSRRAVLKPKVLDPNGVVADMEQLLRRLIEENIRLDVVAGARVPRVRVDPGQMGQVLMNLAVNARDAMPHGGRLTIETRAEDLDAGHARRHPGARPGRYVAIRVSDTGVGMSDEVRARLFEPFFTTKEKGRGTGLGLATVYGIVAQSGGHVEVDTAPARGTTFTIYLPAVEEPVTAGDDEPAPARIRVGLETVLLVEDQADVRKIGVLSLQVHGYTVLAAADGPEALALVERDQPRVDILVTDVVMPGMSGRQLAERLRALRPGLKVLYMSGYTDDAVVRQGVLQQEVAFLAKPYSPSALARKVREVLDQA